MWDNSVPGVPGVGGLHGGRAIFPHMGCTGPFGSGLCQLDLQNLHVARHLTLPNFANFPFSLYRLHFHHLQIYERYVEFLRGMAVLARGRAGGRTDTEKPLPNPPNDKLVWQPSDQSLGQITKTSRTTRRDSQKLASITSEALYTIQDLVNI